MHGQDGGDDGAERPVEHRGDIAEHHQHHEGGGAAVHQLGQGAEQLGDLGAAGAGGAHDDHQAHLEGQGELAAQAVPPGDEQLQGALAAEQGEHKDHQHQDDTEHEGLGDDFLSGEVKLLADAPQDGALGLGRGLA